MAAGEQLTERQALQALLLPSANNIAAVLADGTPAPRTGLSPG
jgi:D-alanyl-D-alanine carboxypeptidase